MTKKPYPVKLGEHETILSVHARTGIADSLPPVLTVFIADWSNYTFRREFLNVDEVTPAMRPLFGIKEIVDSQVLHALPVKKAKPKPKKS